MPVQSPRTRRRNVLAKAKAKGKSARAQAAERAAVKRHRASLNTRRGERRKILSGLSGTALRLGVPIPVVKATSKEVVTFFKALRKRASGEAVEVVDKAINGGGERSTLHVSLRCITCICCEETLVCERVAGFSGTDMHSPRGPN